MQRLFCTKLSSLVFTLGLNAIALVPAGFPDRALRRAQDGIAIAEEHELGFLKGILQSDLETDDVVLGSVEIVDGRLQVEAFTDPARVAVRKWMEETGQTVEVGKGTDLLTFRFSDARAQEVRERGMSQVLEVLRRRIEDPLKGIPDSVVTRQGVDWPCGQWVTEQAKERYQGRRAVCEKIDQDRYGRVVARCRVGGADVGQQLVSDGLAFAYRKYSCSQIIFIHHRNHRIVKQTQVRNWYSCRRLCFNNSYRMKTNYYNKY